MFRLVQQTQVLKTRVPNQFVSASRNSLNSQLRFNSAVSVDRSASQDAAAAAAASASNGSGKNYANNSIERNVKKVRNLRKNIKFDTFKTSADSPWFAKNNALNDCIANALESSSSRQPDGTYLNQSPLFWDSVSQAMSLYRELAVTNTLRPQRVSRLIQLLHVALKVNRTQLTSMNKKPDYDSQSFHKEMTNYLCESLREISSDILSNRVTVSEFGAMHLLSSFKELLLYDETLEIWKSAVGSSNQDIVKPFMHPTVVGVVLPLLYENGTNFEEIKELYEKSASMNTKKTMDPGLTLGMIKTSLAANETEHALTLFQDMCSSNSFGHSPYISLTGTHLAFIGECKDLFVAKSFFERALSDDMPYKMNLQVSSVKQLIQNIWDQTHDFTQVVEIWVKATKYYGKNVSHGISSSLNSKFFSIFFENYLSDKVIGLENLKELIGIYNNVKRIDEPFLNIILTKCTVWQDRGIIESLEQSYDLYHIPKTIVTYRILLKAMGSIDVPNDTILKRWRELIQKADEIGQTYIANADWAALRDATVTYAQQQLDNGKNEGFKMTESQSYNPALEAANASGAFDDFGDGPEGQKQDQNSYQHKDMQHSELIHEDRVLLYYQLVKRYGGYCRDSKQFTRITSGIASTFPVAQPYLALLRELDTSEIYIPPLRNFQLKN